MFLNDKSGVDKNRMHRDVHNLLKNLNNESFQERSIKKDKRFKHCG